MTTNITTNTTTNITTNTTITNITAAAPLIITP
jgi:hypothetical protein